MLLFRSEQAVDEWCAARGRARGAVFTVEAGWALAEEWARGRLDPNWREADRAAMAGRLAALGFTGEFWALPEERS